MQKVNDLSSLCFLKETACALLLEALTHYIENPDDVDIKEFIGIMASIVHYYPLILLL